MEIASKIGLKVQKKMHKNHGNYKYKLPIYVFFKIILETVHCSRFWSVPSQFKIFWSPGGGVVLVAVVVIAFERVVVVILVGAL